MSVEGLCQICESAPAKHRCRRCGALVCSSHYDETTGLCTDCAAAVSDPRSGSDSGADLDADPTSESESESDGSTR